ncbi:uncharacterized protein [Ptychodera flava]|uniref:uncharacterized protein n=1 Tax=Ptychodera flava TaxID=63121 RepID=UPI00396A6CAA
MSYINRSRGRLTYKIILLGELGVGKTSLFTRLRDGVFDELRTQSSALDNCNRDFHVDGETITLSIWDTAGVERYRTLTKNYYRGTHAAIFVYSVDDPSSLHYLSQWVRDAEEYADGAFHFLVGNKCDAPSLINEKTVKDFAATHNIDHSFTLSAKTGEKVQETMVTVARILRAPAKQIAKVMKYHSNVDYEESNSTICLEQDRGENDRADGNMNKTKTKCC